MGAIDRTVYLGKTAAAELVFAHVRITPGTGTEVEYIDHTVKPEPIGIGISFSLFHDKPSSRGRTPDKISPRWELSGGQVPADERVLVGEVSEHVRAIERAWSTTHLNQLRAACEHMTYEMLNPGDEVIAAWMAEHPDVESYNALPYWRLDTVTCPVSGYRWGSKWLAETPEPAVVTALLRAVDALPKVAS